MFMLLQVPCQFPDPSCEKRDLNIGRTGVCRVATELLYDLLSLFLVQPRPFTRDSLSWPAGNYTTVVWA